MHIRVLCTVHHVDCLIWTVHIRVLCTVYIVDCVIWTVHIRVLCRLRLVDSLIWTMHILILCTVHRVDCLMWTVHILIIIIIIYCNWVFHPVAVVLTLVHTTQIFSPGGSSPYTSTHNTNGHVIYIKATIQYRLYTITKQNIQ
jgi:hypothetical protein